MSISTKALIEKERVVFEAKYLKWKDTHATFCKEMTDTASKRIQGLIGCLMKWMVEDLAILTAKYTFQSEGVPDIIGLSSNILCIMDPDPVLCPSFSKIDKYRLTFSYPEARLLRDKVFCTPEHLVDFDASRINELLQKDIKQSCLEKQVEIGRELNKKESEEIAAKVKATYGSNANQRDKYHISSTTALILTSNITPEALYIQQREEYETNVQSQDLQSSNAKFQQFLTNRGQFSVNQSSHNRPFFLKFLLEIGWGSPHSAKPEGETASMIAARECNTIGLSILISAGADLSQKTSKGEVVVDYLQKFWKDKEDESYIKTLYLLQNPS